MLELLVFLVFIMVKLMHILLSKTIRSFEQIRKVPRKPHKLSHCYFLVNCLKFFAISLNNFNVKS